MILGTVFFKYYNRMNITQKTDHHPRFQIDSVLESNHQFDHRQWRSLRWFSDLWSILSTWSKIWCGKLQTPVSLYSKNIHILLVMSLSLSMLTNIPNKLHRITLVRFRAHSQQKSIFCYPYRSQIVEKILRHVPSIHEFLQMFWYCQWLHKSNYFVKSN